MYLYLTSFKCNGLNKTIEIFYFFFFFWRILSILTHTHKGRDEKIFKETNSGVYPKESNF